MDGSPGGNYAIGSADLVLRIDRFLLTKMMGWEGNVVKSEQKGENALLTRTYSFYPALSLPLALVTSWNGFSFSQTFSHMSVNKKHAYVE